MRKPIKYPETTTFGNPFPTHKVCNGCHQDLPKERFSVYTKKGKILGLLARCKKCHSQQVIKSHQKAREVYKNNKISEHKLPIGFSKQARGTGKLFTLADEDREVEYARSAMDASRHLDSPLLIRTRIRFAKAAW